MTTREMLTLIGYSLAGYVTLFIVQLIWGRPLSTGIFFVALGGAFAGGFGYWYGEHRKSRRRPTR